MVLVERENTRSTKKKKNNTTLPLRDDVVPRLVRERKGKDRTATIIYYYYIYIYKINTIRHTPNTLA